MATERPRGLCRCLRPIRPNGTGLTQLTRETDPAVRDLADGFSPDGKRIIFARTVDGGPFQEGSVTTFAVANGRCFGGGMVVAPGALLDDGVFHVTIWSGYSLSDFVLRSAAMYDGSHVKLKGTRTATARSVRLEPLPGARGPLDIEADGELIGRLPATFTVVPGVVRLVS